MATRISSQAKAKKKLDHYAGEWVVFVGDRIVAHDKKLARVMAAVEKKNLQRKASVFLVPRKDEGPYVLLIIA